MVVCWLQFSSVLQSTVFYPAVQVSWPISWAPQSAPRNSWTKICWWCRAIFLRPSKWPHILSNFDEAAHTMGLNTSWSKTKIQNLGHGITPAPVQLQGHVVESRDRFTYLGSDIHSSERSTPKIHRRIGLASNIFGRLANIMEADRIESTDEDTALQCPCHLRTVIWLWDMDSPEGWWTAIRSIPHELPTTDLRNPLVPFCHERLSH